MKNFDNFFLNIKWHIKAMSVSKVQNMTNKKILYFINKRNGNKKMFYVLKTLLIEINKIKIY